ncbi:MAG: methyl-accepting chemotaxis protein [Spirochaetota bacterium]
MVYCVFLPLALSFTDAERFSFWFRMGTVGLLFDGLATSIVFRLYRPIRQALAGADSAGAMDSATRSRAALAIDGIPSFLLWFGATAYVAAAAVNLGLDFAKNGALVAGLALARLSLAAAWGFLNGIVTARFLDIILFEAKIALAIHHPDEITRTGRAPRVSFARRLATSGFALFAFLVIFSGVLHYTSSIGITREAIAAAAKAISAGQDAVGDKDLAWKVVSMRMPGALAVLAGLLVIAGLLFVVILAEMQTRLNSLLSQIERLAMGDRDLAARVNVSSIDDIGRLTGSFNRILDSLARTFASVRAQASGIYAESASIKRTSLDARMEAEQLALLASETEEAERERVVELGRAMTAFRKVANGIGESASKSAEEAREIETAAEGLKSMAASLAASGTEAAQADLAFLALKESVQNGAAGVARSLETVAAIDETGRRVGGIALVIEGVADRSNLLAMNASIEAAHAGEAGKGFGVVAREMKKLAESVAKSAHDIAAELSGVQEKNRRAVEAIKGLGAIFDELTQGIGATGEALAVIANSARKNADEARTDLALIERLRSLTADLLSASESARSSVSDMEGAASRLATSQSRSGEVNAALADGGPGLGWCFAKLEGSLGSALGGIERLEGELSSYKIG